MRAWLDVTDGGFGNTVQDTGRTGYRHMGLAVSGFLDPIFAACANLLAGNPADAAAIEMRGLGPTLTVRQGPLRVALSGAVAATILRQGGGTQHLPPWQSATLHGGDTLKCGAVGGGTAYLAVSGGVDVAPCLGSRATYRQAGLGGVDGRPLAAGDALPCHACAAGKSDGQPADSREHKAEAWQHAAGPIRVIPGPQADCFAEGEIARFLAADYSVSRDSDRMGMRLEGPALRHLGPAHADIVSDAVAPGALQVPGNGLPILLLADCQTVGGYPKIATVIGADLPRLAQCRPGDALRFAAVGLPEAHAALRHEAERLESWRQGIVTYLPPGYLDLDALYRCNLIDGAVRADPPLYE